MTAFSTPLPCRVLDQMGPLDLRQRMLDLRPLRMGPMEMILDVELARNFMQTRLTAEVQDLVELVVTEASILPVDRFVFGVQLSGELSEDDAQALRHGLFWGDYRNGHFTGAACLLLRTRRSLKAVPELAEKQAPTVFINLALESPEGFNIFDTMDSGRRVCYVLKNPERMHFDPHWFEL